MVAEVLLYIIWWEVFGGKYFMGWLEWEGSEPWRQIVAYQITTA